MNELKELERQRAEIQQRIWAIESERDAKESAKFVGRCFKFLNSYGTGEKWWLYFAVTGFDGQLIKGFQFEHKSDGRFEAHRTTKTNDVDRFTEITRVELEEAWDDFCSRLGEDFYADQR